MLTSLRAYKDATNFLEFVIGQSASYEVKNIQGLGPTPAQVVHTPMVDLMGQHSFHDSNLAARSIKITLALVPGLLDVQQLRDQLYKYFPTFSKTTLRFYDTVRQTVFVDGWVESCEPNVFSSDPEMVITIACPDAYFSALASVSRANIAANGTYTFSNPGNADVGFAFNVAFTTGSGDTIKIYENSTPEKYFLITNWTAAGSWQVSLVEGSKKVMTGTAQKLSSVSSLSTWITLEPGDNQLVFELSGVSSVSALSWLPKWSSL